MISCEGELRAKLAYLLLISGNSGVQKRLAYQAQFVPCRIHCLSNAPAIFILNSFWSKIVPRRN